jgi:hypothetical protein
LDTVFSLPHLPVPGFSPSNSSVKFIDEYSMSLAKWRDFVRNTTSYNMPELHGEEK